MTTSPGAAQLADLPLADQAASRVESARTEAPNGVTTGSVQVTEKQLASWVDRLGKAGAKSEQASAWMMVGRVQADLMALLIQARGDA